MVMRDAIGWVLAAGLGSAAGCAGQTETAVAPAGAGPTIAGPNCAVGECNARGMQALARAHYEEAAGLLDRACQLGSAEGCFNLGGLYREAGTGRQSLPRSHAAFERSCELGMAAGCMAGARVTADPLRSAALVERACALKHANGCFDAGMAAKDPGVRAQRLDQACGLGHGTGCFNAGILLYSERGAKPGDNERAAQYFGRACDAHEAAGCLRLGIASLRGVGTRADAQAAKDLFDRACRAGDEDGCAAAQQVSKDRGRRGAGLAIALTSTASSLMIGGLRMVELSCRMPSVGPMALAEAVEAVAAHKAAIDACAPAGAAPRVSWAWQGRRATQVKVQGAGPKVEACVKRAVERSRADLEGTCAATVLVGDPTGAQQALADRRSGGGAVALRSP